MVCFQTSSIRSNGLSMAAARLRNPCIHSRTGKHQWALSRSLPSCRSGRSGRFRGRLCFQAYVYPAHSSTVPSIRPTSVAKRTYLGVHTPSGPQVIAARCWRQSSTAPPIRLSAATPVRIARYGPASVATLPSHADPTPIVANVIGRAQHEARPNAAAMPAPVKRAAPPSTADRSVGGTSAVGSDIAASLRMIPLFLTVCSNYRLKQFFADGDRASRCLSHR